ncbi:MAG: hypothetical protein NXH72_10630 [Hyphomonadaceae bacterium]|nr:hypothetical protein [Hyphomonadaceae bacterium]
MPPETHGYSGKPLFQKLGLKPGMTCLTLRAPAHLPELLAGVEGVRFPKRAAPADCVIAFCLRLRHVAPLIERAMSSVVKGGMIWAAWPKKSSDLYKDLTEQDFRNLVLPLGWVDVKVCAIDQDWSGLKFLQRKA